MNLKTLSSAHLSEIFVYMNKLLWYVSRDALMIFAACCLFHQCLHKDAVLFLRTMHCKRCVSNHANFAKGTGLRHITVLILVTHRTRQSCVSSTCCTSDRSRRGRRSWYFLSCCCCCCQWWMRCWQRSCVSGTCCTADRSRRGRQSWYCLSCQKNDNYTISWYLDWLYNFVIYVKTH